MLNPKISIIIPVYGVEEFIRNCIESIVEQTYDNIEVILINDCSIDNSIEIANEIIKEYHGKIQFIIVNHQINKKQAGARNTGIKKSTGEYIFFLDSDDQLFPDAIASLVNEALKSNADVITANRKSYNFYTGEEYKLLEKDYAYYITQDVTQCQNIEFQGTVWNKLIKRSFIIKHNLFFEEGIYYEDDLWIFKLLCSRPIISFIPNYTYIYYIRKNSTIQTYSEVHLYSRIIVAEETLRYIINNPDTPKPYTYYTLDSFREGALKDTVQRVNGIKNYFTLYTLFRSNNLILKIFKEKIKITTRLRLLHYYLPRHIGAIYELFFLKIKCFIWPYKPIFNIKVKINLSPNFWNKIQSYEERFL